MNKFLLVPDSFKGTLSATEVCGIMRDTILRLIPDAQVLSIPVADGGEGTVDCFVEALKCEKVFCSVSDPVGLPVEGFFGLLPDGRAIIEMAAAAGLPLMEGRLDPLGAGTYGVGQLIGAALDRGARSILLGLGGSATTDGGCGAAAALGVRFLDEAGSAFIPTGGTLERISTMDMSGLDPRVGETTFTAMCDIDNPLYGPRGAAHIFAPQKGASPEQVDVLDKGLIHLSAILAQTLGRDVSALPGAGAAGGMGACASAILGAQLRRGIDAVLDTVRFENLLRDCDLVFTGEGKLDSQSLGGKVVLGVSLRAKAQGIPVVAVVGGADEGISGIYDCGITAVFPINRMPQDFSVSRYHSRENLSATTEDIIRLLRR